VFSHGIFSSVESEISVQTITAQIPSQCASAMTVNHLVVGSIPTRAAILASITSVSA
jgi:hypothetical protein